MSVRKESPPSAREATLSPPPVLLTPCLICEFPYKYPDEEKVLIICGKATLTPDDKEMPSVTISAGDAVTFHAGFSCKWHVTEPMQKHYVVEGGDEPKILCDSCDVNCFAESYFVEKYELDICPACFKKARGAEKKKYAGAQLQREGEPVDGEDEDDEKSKKKRKEPAAAAEPAEDPKRADGKRQTKSPKKFDD